MTADPIRALLEVVEILEDLGLPYAVGGSVASSIFGEPRASADADLVVELAERQLPDLVSRLESTFYLSAEAARDAIRRRSSFNVIHLETMYKVDLFVAGPALLDREQLSRRRRILLVEDPERWVFMTAPEDVVLRKLDWHRQGGGTSDKQWRDVVGVLKLQGDRLDLPYLRRSAHAAGLEDQLARALGEAGLD